MLGVAWFTGGALLGAAVIGGSPVAWADFRDPASTSAQLAADVLQPPSGLGATSSCRTQIELTWTATPTSWLERYDVALADAPGGPFTVRPPEGGQSPTATSRVVDGLSRKTTYYVTVRSVRGSWSSGVTPVTVQTQGRAC